MLEVISNITEAISLEAGYRPPSVTSRLKILSLVEASTINAVAKNVLAFSRSARELSHTDLAFPQIDNEIVTFERTASSQEPNEFVRAARDLGVCVKVIPERRRFDLTVIPALRKIVDETKPDLIVTHSVKSHFLVWRSRLWRTHRWIAFHHGYTTTDGKMRAYNQFDRWSLAKADCLVTVCNAFARELAHVTGVPLERIVVQHNSIRPKAAPSAEVVRELRERFGIASDERVLLSVGRLSREKAHMDLLVAFKLLRTEHPELKCKLLIVGDGPERAKLEAAAREFVTSSTSTRSAAGTAVKKKSAGVIFAGQQSDVAPFYALADVFVLPSHSEGSPNVLLEAMSVGVPIVATNVGGVPEIFRDTESALLAQANNPRELSLAIARLLMDNDLGNRLTSNAWASILNRFSPDQYTRALVRTYQTVASARNTIP